MFAVVISEKGGAERRQNFEDAEVTIGRVRSNDVVLPKGNVSKRHSRIVLKNRRFIVMDLKSTNGTYVNGRRVTAPMVVKEGDKIYIGDFVLTLESEAAAKEANGSAKSKPARPAPATPSAGLLSPKHKSGGEPPGTAPPPLPRSKPAAASASIASGQDVTGDPEASGQTGNGRGARSRNGAPPVLSMELAGGDAGPDAAQALSSTTVHDGAEGILGEDSPEQLNGAAELPIETGHGSATTSNPDSKDGGMLPGLDRSDQREGLPPPAVLSSPAPADESLIPVDEAPVVEASIDTREASKEEVLRALGSPQGDRKDSPNGQPDRNALQKRPSHNSDRIMAGQPLDLGHLMKQLTATFDVHDQRPSFADQATRQAQADQAIEKAFEDLDRKGLRVDPAGRGALRLAAMREATGHGPLDELLEDTSIEHVVVQGTESIRVDRGEGLRNGPWAFSSEQALRTAALRMGSAQAEDRDEQVGVKRWLLPQGAEAVLLEPPITLGGPALSLRKRPEAKLRLGDLRADGTLTAPQITFLRECLALPHNVLVIGPANARSARLLSALLAETPAQSPVALIEGHPQVAVGDRGALCLRQSSAPTSLLLDQVRHFGAPRLIVNPLPMSDAEVLLDSFACHRDASLCGMLGSSAETAVQRLAGACEPHTLTEAFKAVVELPAHQPGGVMAAAVFKLVEEPSDEQGFALQPL